MPIILPSNNQILVSLCLGGKNIASKCSPFEKT
jgi:hypothetical protein